MRTNFNRQNWGVLTIDDLQLLCMSPEKQSTCFGSIISFSRPPKTIPYKFSAKIRFACLSRLWVPAHCRVPAHCWVRTSSHPMSPSPSVPKSLSLQVPSSHIPESHVPKSHIPESHVLRSHPPFSHSYCNACVYMYHFFITFMLKFTKFNCSANFLILRVSFLWIIYHS